MIKRTFLLSLLFVAACHGRRAGIPTTGEPLSGRVLEEVSRQLYSRATEIRTYRCLAATHIQADEVNERYRQVFVFERPDRLRVEFLPQQAFYSVALLVAQRGWFTFLNVEAKEALRSELTPRQVKKMLGIPASYPELFSFLSARVPDDFFMGGNLDPERFKLTETGGNYVLASSDGAYTAEIDPVLLLVKRLAVRDKFNEKLLFTAELGDPKGVGPSSAIPFYQSIRLRIFEGDADVSLRLDSISANTPVKAGLFEADIPGDYELKEE